MDSDLCCLFVAEWPWISYFTSLILCPLWNMEISLIPCRNFD